MVRVEPIVTILSVEREIYDAFISRLQLKSLQFQSFFGPKWFWLGESSVLQTSKNILQKVKIISCFIQLSNLKHFPQKSNPSVLSRIITFFVCFVNGFQHHYRSLISQSSSQFHSTLIQTSIDITWQQKKLVKVFQVASLKRVPKVALNYTTL